MGNMCSACNKATHKKKKKDNIKSKSGKINN